MVFSWPTPPIVWPWVENPDSCPDCLNGMRKRPEKNAPLESRERQSPDWRGKKLEQPTNREIGVPRRRKNHVINGREASRHGGRFAGVSCFQEFLQPRVRRASHAPLREAPQFQA